MRSSIKRFLLTSLVGLLSVSFITAQDLRIEGTVRDGNTGEALIGAAVMIGEGRGVVTGLDGRYSIKVEPGEYTVKVSYVGYETGERTVRLVDKNAYLDFELENITINEVTIVADVARSRVTPVAFSNVDPRQIEEELGGRDIPMVLNTTPGVYATQQGGGDGDARITIRGFDQRNIAVMIDGIPVNDMENGWVYWSNWFGLDEVTRTIQVQRGLGASKLALPSVGGTLNILTRGIDNERSLSVKQSIDSQGKSRTSISLTSGQLKNGWGFTLAGSFKRGEGWVDNTFSNAWFYFFRIDKRLNNHVLTFSGMGAPQWHEQRSYPRAITTYSHEYAKDLGIDVNATDSAGNYLYRSAISNMGIDYNQHWGMLRRDRFDPDAPMEKLSGRVNEYHKPQLSLRDFWTVSDKLSVSNILYASFGFGGGNQPYSSIEDEELIQDPDHPYYGQIDWQSIYDANAKSGPPPFFTKPIKPKYSDSLYYSSNYMTRQHNEHLWVGLLSTLSYQMNNKLEISGGLDLRSYKGIHYQTITDLLGGDYTTDDNNENYNYAVDPTLAMRYQGDTINYHDDGLVRWGGIFAQAEYINDRVSTFLNLTTALKGYNKIDYFAKPPLDESGWKWIPGFTVKTGLNYNLTRRHSIFFNAGYLSKARAYRNVYDGFTTNFLEDTENEIIKALETGYHFGSPRFSGHLNAYLTLWQNKPTRQARSNYVLQPGDPDYEPGGDPQDNEVRVYANIPGMDARHMGVELDFVWIIHRKLELQGLVSIGNWLWDKVVDSLRYYNYDTRNPVNKYLSFDSRGIHVGDAAQTQLGSSIRFEPIKGMYLNLRQTFYARHYAEFNPETTRDENGNIVDSWKIPTFNLLDLHAGYRFGLPELTKARFEFKISVFNLLDGRYITDAENNDPFISPQYNDFDAKSAGVFFGMGRRFLTSFKISF